MGGQRVASLKGHICSVTPTCQQSSCQMSESGLQESFYKTALLTTETNQKALLFVWDPIKKWEQNSAQACWK